MKRFLPVILLGLGLLVVVGAFFFVKSRNKTDDVEEEDTSSMIDVSLQDSPVVSITPRTDGHWVDLKVSNLKKFEASTFEYQLLFDVPKSGLQGESGTVKLGELEGDTYEKEILVGTQSSGNYYYYNNVETGEFAMKFRNDAGKLVAKFETQYNLQTDVDEVTSLDGKLKLKLEDTSDLYFLTMNTFGIPEGLDITNAKFGPYGVFSSGEDLSGKVDREDVNYWSDGSWHENNELEAFSSVIFVSSK